MTPRELLLYTAVTIILLNVLIMRIREKKTTHLEKILREKTQQNQKLTPQDIAQTLALHIYDAKILAKKLTSRGRMELTEKNGIKTYAFKSQHEQTRRKQ